MSREIKFRGWDAKAKEMLYLHDLPEGIMLGVTDDGFFAMCKQELDDDGISDTHVEIDFVAMQYTGLKDKNGVEIYEGDVIQYQDPFETRNYVEVTVSVEINPYDGVNFNSMASDIEVIGNIHENPELLEVKS